jgi:transposase
MLTILALGFPRVRRAGKQRSQAREDRRSPRRGHPAPEKVRDPKFQESDFFDPRDAVQVKYEMLRRVSVEKASVTDTSDEYGVSRPTYYQAKADFEQAGIAGLVPKKRGPRGPHKIRSEILAFLRTRLVPGEPIRARELARLIQQEFGLDVHPRTIERAIGGKKSRDNARHGREASDGGIYPHCPVRDGMQRRFPAASCRLPGQGPDR